MVQKSGVLNAGLATGIILRAQPKDAVKPIAHRVVDDVLEPSRLPSFRRSRCCADSRRFPTAVSLTEDAHPARKVRIFANARAVVHRAVCCGSGEARRLGGGPQHAPETGVAIAHCSAVRQRRRDHGGCPRRRQKQADGGAVAGALAGARRHRPASRCQPSRPQAAVVGGGDRARGPPDAA
jgi:hypothetical protein